MFASLICCLGRVPKESDEPKVGSCTQRPAISRDVDSDSRSSKNSQSSTEQTDLKAQEKLTSVDNILDDTIKNEKGAEDKTRFSSSRQRRVSYSRALESQKTSLIPTRGDKRGGKLHFWKKDPRSNHDCDGVQSSRHGSELDSDVSSFGSHFSGTRHASMDTNKSISSEDTISMSGGSRTNVDANTQLARKDRASPAAIPSRFQFRRSSSLSQRETDLKDNLEEPSKQKDNAKTTGSKSNKNFMKSRHKTLDNSSSESKVQTDESNDKNVKAKTMIHKMKKPFKKFSAGNFEKIPSDENNGNKKGSLVSKGDTEVKKSKVSRVMDFMTRGQDVTSKGSDKNRSSSVSKEQQKADEKGKDGNVFRQHSFSLCTDVRENERRQLSDKCSQENATKRDIKVRAASRGVVLEKLLLPSKIKISQNPFEAKQSISKTTLGNTTHLQTSKAPLRKCLSLSVEDLKHPVLRKTFSCVQEELTDDGPNQKVIGPSAKAWTHVQQFDRFETRRWSNGVTDPSEGNTNLRIFQNNSDMSMEEGDDTSIKSWTHVQRVDHLDYYGDSQDVTSPNEEDNKFRVSKNSSDMSKEGDTDPQIQSWAPVQQFSCSQSHGHSNDASASSDTEASIVRFKGKSDDTNETDLPTKPCIQDFSSFLRLDQPRLATSPSEIEVNLARFQEYQLNSMKHQENSGKLMENFKIKPVWSGSDMSDTLSVVTEIPEPGGDCHDFNFDLDPDSDDTFQDTRFEDSFSDDNDIRNEMETCLIFGRSSEQVGYNSVNTDGGNNDFKTWSLPEDLNLYFHRRDSGIKFESIFELGSGGASKCSQLSQDEFKAISKNDYLRSSPICKCGVPDLKFENHSCFTVDHGKRETFPEELSLLRNDANIFISQTSLNSSWEVKQTDGSDDESPNKDELIDDKVNINGPDNFDEKCPISLLVDSSGKNKPEQKQTLLSLAMTSAAWQNRNSSQSTHCSYMPDFAVGHGDVTQRRSQTNRKMDSEDCNHIPHEESTKDTDSGITSGNTTRTTTPDERGQSLGSPSNQQSVPKISVTNTCSRSFNEEDDDLEELFINKLPNQLLGSRSSLADSRESIYSVYSDAGEVNYGRIPVTGEIMFHIAYNHKSNALEVHIKQCRDLAPVDTKHAKSDPYVKTYLLPDKSRASKRKTRIKKHTLNPVFDEVLRYQISSSELDSRSLWLTVWHNDRLGRNDFLGEVTIPLDYYRLDQSAPMWYPLMERAVSQDPVMFYKGDLFIALKFVPADMVETAPKKKPSSFRRKNKEKEAPEPVHGEVHVLVREAKNLTAMRASAGSNPFCKGYILPDMSHASKQKTPVVKKTTNPQWQHILMFEGVDESQLHDYGVELTIWDYEKMSSNDFLGGVRLNLGRGVYQGQPADWMDAKGEEVEAWQNMIDHPNEWVDVELPLRASMGKQTVKN